MTKCDGGGIHKNSGSTYTNMKIDHNIVLHGVMHDETLGIPMGTTSTRQYNIYWMFINDPSNNPFTISNNIIGYNQDAGININCSRDANNNKQYYL